MRARLVRRLLVVAMLLALIASLGFGIAQADRMVRDHAYRGEAPICRVRTKARLVALSFDDGPNPVYTPRVLALLKRFGARATFFVTGARAKAYPRLIDIEIASGMELGNHTWSHPRLPSLSTDLVASEVRSTQIELQGHRITLRLFRAPYGMITPADLEAIEPIGMKTIHWSLAPDHYVGGMKMSARQAAIALEKRIRPGDIILAHDSPGRHRAAALEALRLLLAQLAARDITVTTVSDLLAHGKAVEARPHTWFWEDQGFSCLGR